MLFTGESNLGKRTLAIEFIKLLNCQNPVNCQPCGTCENCRAIAKNIYPELTIIEPEEKEIRVAQIRKLRARLNLRSFSDCFKAVILDKANSLNQEAQSAFLKLLEEPKGKTLFILIARHPEMLFPTILSRVEILKFYPAPDHEIKEELKKKGLSENQAQEIVSLSWGRPGRAVNFLQNPKEFENAKQELKEIVRLINSDLSFRFQYAKKISAQPKEIKNILDIWLRYFRNELIEKSQASSYSLSRLRKILEIIQKTQFLLSNTNVNPKLAIEMVMLEI